MLIKNVTTINLLQCYNFHIIMVVNISNVKRIVYRLIVYNVIPKLANIFTVKNCDKNTGETETKTF